MDRCIYLRQPDCLPALPMVDPEEARDMRTLFVVGLVALVVAATVAATARATPAGAVVTPPDISVTGEGRVHGPPDVARVRLGVEVFGSTLAPADTEADQRVSAIVRSLRAANVPEAH